MYKGGRGFAVGGAETVERGVFDWVVIGGEWGE